MKRKFWKIAALITALLLILGVGWFANALVGNPVSRLLAQRSAAQYLEKTYPGQQLIAEKARYSFKEEGYYVHVSSLHSEDVAFSLSFDFLGHLKYDDYDSRVTQRGNTANRLEMEYRALADTVLESSTFPYEGFWYGTLGLYSSEDAVREGMPPDACIPPEELELDEIYDIRELGKRAGKLVLVVDDAEASEARAAEILLDIRERMDRAGIPFRGVDFSLRKRRDEEGGGKADSIDIRWFPWEDIREDGMAERLHQAAEATRIYYEEQDRKKG